MKYLIFTGLIILPVVLCLLPASFFDQGQSICFSVLVFNKECFGCGITRAVQHLIHFDFQTAWNFNKLVIVVAPVLFYLWFNWVLHFWKKIKN